jgi:hypothetical protein
VGVLGGIWWAMGQGCEKLLDPHIAVVSARVDSVNHIPVMSKIDTLEKRLNKKDTISEKTYLLMMEIANSDQKQRAMNKFNERKYFGGN